MNKKSIKTSSKSLIALRDSICKDKTRYWRIIKSENVMSIKAKKAGIGSGFDLAALHNKILQMSDTLIKVKLMLNDINRGVTKFDYEEAKKSHYYNIFKASELKEQLAHWEEIMKKATLNPVAKAKAGSAGKSLGKTETFTSDKINAIKKKLQLEINKIDGEIAKFNESASIEITDDNDDIIEMMAA